MQRYKWRTKGDVNAFFGLMLDNVAGMVLTVTLLAATFKFPTNFALQNMIPGAALGVLIGDVLFTWLAFRLAKQTGRTDVTAMPLGLDTPSTFGMVFFVLGPSFLEGLAKGLSESDAARRTWLIGACAIVTSGVFKIFCSLAANRLRRAIPSAGLLGSLASVAIVLISFMPLLDIAQYPVVGFVALAIILTTLVARIEAPFRIPGAFAALIVGAVMYYALAALGLIHAEEQAIVSAGPFPPTGWHSIFPFAWTTAFKDSLTYLPVVIPFALATVVGGIDCTESAAAAGDEYDAGQVVLVEGFATLIAGLCGGVIQTTPYIGHPAYKAMGGRAAYTLATALFIGAAGMLGLFAHLSAWIPRPAIYPILIFIGLEISAQSFLATKKEHYPAVALAVIPALAALVMVFADGLLAQAGAMQGKGPLSIDDLAPPLRHQLQTARILSGGFILTSLLWASLLAALIDKRLIAAAVVCLVAAGCSVCGIIHSPLPNGGMIFPWQTDILPKAAAGQGPLHFACAYGLCALLLWGWHIYRVKTNNIDAPLAHH